MAPTMTRILTYNIYLDTVCGSDGSDYDSYCHLQKESCQLQRNVTKVHHLDLHKQDQIYPWWIKQYCTLMKGILLSNPNKTQGVWLTHFCCCWELIKYGKLGAKLGENKRFPFSHSPLSDNKARNASTLWIFVLIISQVNLFYTLTPDGEVNTVLETI